MTTRTQAYVASTLLSIALIVIASYRDAQYRQFNANLKALPKRAASCGSVAASSGNLKDLQKITKVFAREADKYYKQIELNERKLK